MMEMTKKTMYNALITLATTGSLPEDVTMENVATFATHEIELLDKRAAKAKETKAAKAKEPDVFTEAIAAVISDEYMTAADVVAAVGNEELTVSKATYRLNALAEAGVIEKADVKVEGAKHTRKAYKRA